MLNEYDIEILMEALDSYEKEDMSDAFMMSMLSIGLSKNEDENEQRQKIEERMKEGQEKQRAKLDNVILIKAKLIQMREKLITGEMAKILKGE